MAPIIDAHGRTFIQHPNGQTTHYILDDFTDPWKPAETVLLQPGFGRHAAFWYHWVPRLARSYRVIRRDLRGHGRSSAPAADAAYDYSLDTVLGEIVDTLDQLGVRRVHFLGESTSGMLAEALAARHPERVLSITTCSSPTVLPPAALRMLALGEESWPAACRKLGARGWAERLARVPGTVANDDPEYVRWWLEQIAVQSGEGLAGAATGVEEQRGIQAQVKGSKLVVIEGKGHEIFTEMAEECQNAFLDFIKEVDSRKA
ncbi:hypothetical protein SLS57_007784 [Botryosphaeria dothidea]